MSHEKEGNVIDSGPSKKRLFTINLLAVSFIDRQQSPTEKQSKWILCWRVVANSLHILFFIIAYTSLYSNFIRSDISVQV